MQQQLLLTVDCKRFLLVELFTFCMKVAQYIKLDSRILQVFLTKFAEEENKEISKMRKRFVSIFKAQLSINTFAAFIRVLSYSHLGKNCKTLTLGIRICYTFDKHVWSFRHISNGTNSTNSLSKFLFAFCQRYDGRKLFKASVLVKSRFVYFIVHVNSKSKKARPHTLLLTAKAKTNY